VVFNKSRSLFLAIICFFTVQTAVLTAAENSSTGSSLWASFVASINSLMPSFNSFMANIAAKISSFMTSTSFSEYKGHAVAGVGGALSGVLATIAGYKVLDRVSKRAKELEMELFKDYPATYSSVEHYMVLAGSTYGSNKTNYARFLGILKDMLIIKEALEKKDQKYGFIDKKALESLLRQREEVLIKLPFTEDLSKEKNLDSYDGVSFEMFTRNGGEVKNGIDVWVMTSRWLFGDNPDERLKGLEWLRSRPIFSDKEDKYGLSKTIALWKKKYEEAVESQVKELKKILMSVHQTAVNKNKQEFKEKWVISDDEREHGLKAMLALRDIGQILTAIDEINTYGFITQKALFSLLNEKEEETIAMIQPSFYSLPLRAKMNYEAISFNDLMNIDCALVRQNYIGSHSQKCLPKYPNVADRTPNKTDSWIANSFSLGGGYDEEDNFIQPTKEERIKSLELLRKISPHYSETADPSDKYGLGATVELLKKKKAEKEKESKTILP